MRKHTEDFKREAVRIALSSGLSRRRVASDLGVGLSTLGKWVCEYLAVILDLHSRRVVGWAVSDRMKKDLAIRALDMAVRLRQPPGGCLFHSDPRIAAP